ncbi:MAG: RsmB/NOP family class I SAM-dependent RNA methyltransferase [Deferrisomatales bacterium]|nr:RsmB/NOP family class I SAM-dependent RNA methyltransferase [Deferrisomatales bacterium]
MAPVSDDLNLRHAVRILQTARELEALFNPDAPPGPPLDRVLQRYQRAHPKMGRRDRLVLGAAVYHLARGRTLLLEAGREFAAGEGDLLLLGLLDAMADPEALGQIPHLPGGVRPWSRRLAWLGGERADLVACLEAAGATALTEAPAAVADALALLFSVPEWWLADGPWQTVAQATAELAALRQPQRLTLRVQAHRCADRAAVIGRLEGLGIPCGATPRSPWGITVEGRHNLLATEVYRDGSVEVQDEGSQLVACLVDPKPTETILDLCAGGGGKSLALAAVMGGRGRILAYDTHTDRLRDARRRARRAGLGNIQVMEDFDAVRRAGPFDQVIADVPCTSSGTLRRNPDAAWRWSRDQMLELTQLQAEILDRAAVMVRPGGFLTYVTCSLLAPENHSQTQAFQERHPEFLPAPPGERTGQTPLLDICGVESGAFRLPATLDRYTGDAFFVARFRKQG